MSPQQQALFVPGTGGHESVLPLGSSYPRAVGFQDTDTSQQAAQAMEPRVETLRRLVLDMLREHRDGLTADSVASLVGESILAVRPRVSELHKAGYVEDSGRREPNASGKSAIVWRAR